MRPTSNGKLENGLAEKVEISPDLKHYTFTIRKAQWSDGLPLTAHDIEYSWKSFLIRSLERRTPINSMSLKMLKLAYEGKVEIAEVGIKAIDDQTLKLSLKIPYHTSWS